MSAEKLESLKNDDRYGLVQRFERGEEVPRFDKLCEYVNQFGEEGGFEAVTQVLSARSIDYYFFT